MHAYDYIYIYERACGVRQSFFLYFSNLSYILNMNFSFVPISIFFYFGSFVRTIKENLVRRVSERLGGCLQKWLKFEGG
jgi:hypothetical protein